MYVHAVALLHTTYTYITVLQYSTVLTVAAAVATVVVILRSVATHGIDCYSIAVSNTCIGHSHTQQPSIQYPRFGITQ